MSEMKIEPIKEIPELSRRRMRDGKCYQAYREAKASPSGKVKVTFAGDQDGTELLRFYRSMSQWRSRHKEESISVTKQAQAVYVEVGEAEAEDGG